MKVTFGTSSIKGFKRAVVALGVFDGLHIGHRCILTGAVKKSREIRGTALVLTFTPHPQGEESLYSLEHRLRLIADLGIDACIVIKFTHAFAEITAEDFVKDILVKKVRASYVYVGSNFRFGKGARGDTHLLKYFSSLYGFKLKVFNVIKIDGKNISSTYIRRLITSGNLRMAELLLCRPVSVFGTVIKGISWAGRMGFPTANINPHHEVLPPPGIYAVRVIRNKNKLSGICYIGNRPTFLMRKSAAAGIKLKSIEVHIFNFKKDIYGEDLEIQFIKKIRNERKFVSRSALITRIRKDIEAARKLFSRH
ncbi:MAG: riboflavin biosynthesis protein RibF [Deltaproteobacteria bacterium]